MAKIVLFSLFATTLFCFAQSPGDLSHWATVESHINGEPVYAFGYTYVYSVSPDFHPKALIQEGNNNPPVKIHPKKSWQIASNLFGSTPAREPRTAPYDDQPLLGLHLIDGDLRSCWSSRGQNQPDFEDAWVRIDLPYDQQISGLALVGHPDGMGRADPKTGSVKVGQSFPRHLEIRISRDAWHWQTVYKEDRYQPENVAGRNLISFNPVVAKQIWIIGSHLPLTHYFGHAFSIAEIEVLDRAGQNIGLLSRGAGVQVSSTHTGFGMDRFTQDMLWPTQYDVGFKWSRVGYDMSLFQWAYVEREKGKYHVDERADAAVTEAVKNGIQVVLCLDKGNWLYAPEPKVKDRTRDLMETYSNNPGPPGGWQAMLLDYPSQWEGYLNYVRFMVNHFKDRVRYFEVWNEWSPYTYEEAKRYARLLKAALPVIRKEFPEAKVIPASAGWIQFMPDRAEKGFSFFKALADEGLLSKVDVLGFHPFYDPAQQDRFLVSFAKDFREFQRFARANGFKGDEYFASEWDFFTAYPNSDLPSYNDREFHSEMQKAIYGSRLSTLFAHLGIVNFWNETFQTMQTMRGLSLFRNTFSNEVICPTQPEVIYYMFRTLATALDGATGSEIPSTFAEARGAPLPPVDTGQTVVQYGFQRERELLIAFWKPGPTGENGKDYVPLVMDVTMPNLKLRKATLIDVLNGTETPLTVNREKENLLIPKVAVESWPRILRVTE
ncbi:MAG: discoidin domain-containing protein [Terriglobia bacterium]